MKFVYKGSIKSEQEIPEFPLHKGAIKYKEAETLGELRMCVIGYALLSGALVIGIKLLGNAFGANQVEALGGLPIISLILAICTVVPHEYLHAVCYGKGSVVEMHVCFRKCFWVLVCEKSVSKARFVFMSLLPNIILGWMPLLAWLLVPFEQKTAELLFSYCFLVILAGSEDYIKVFNTLRQVPKGGWTQQSGGNSYWYIPEKE